MGATGTAVLDFGTAPGSCVASVSVTGQASIASTCFAEAWIMAEASADHTAEDHRYAAALLGPLTCDVPTDGVGFTVSARCIHGELVGQFNIRWVWDQGS